MKIPRTRDDFIAFFEAIPEDQWTDCGQFRDGQGRCCALGHLNREGAIGLGSLPQYQASNLSIVSINDGDDENYKQPTPKQRVLAFLRDLPAT